MTIYTLIRKDVYEITGETYVSVENYDSLEKAQNAMTDSYESDIVGRDEEDEVVEDECTIDSMSAYVVVDERSAYGYERCCTSYEIKENQLR